MAEKEIKIEYDSDSKKLTFFRRENEDWQRAQTGDAALGAYIGKVFDIPPLSRDLLDDPVFAEGLARTGDLDDEYLNRNFLDNESLSRDYLSWSDWKEPFFRALADAVHAGKEDMVRIRFFGDEAASEAFYKLILTLWDCEELREHIDIDWVNDKVNEPLNSMTEEEIRKDGMLLFDAQVKMWKEMGQMLGQEQGLDASARTLDRKYMHRSIFCDSKRMYRLFGFPSSESCRDAFYKALELPREGGG